MRTGFEVWAQREHHIVRRREDKPEEYLVYETQRRWLIWQAALAQSGPARQHAPEIPADEARNRVLNEVLEAFSDLDFDADMESIVKVIQGLKKKHKACAKDKTGSQNVHD